MMNHNAVESRHCTQCGYGHPVQARFCMNCGAPFGSSILPRGRGSGTDWAGIATAALASIGLWHASRKARQTIIVVVFLALVFGLPMVCGFAAFVLNWIARLFGV